MRSSTTGTHLDIHATGGERCGPRALLLRQPVAGALHLRRLRAPPLWVPQQQVRHATCVIPAIINFHHCYTSTFQTCWEPPHAD